MSCLLIIALVLNIKDKGLSLLLFLNIILLFHAILCSFWALKKPLTLLHKSLLNFYIYSLCTVSRNFSTFTMFSLVALLFSSLFWHFPSNRIFFYPLWSIFPLKCQVNEMLLYFSLVALLFSCFWVSIIFVFILLLTSIIDSKTHNLVAFPSFSHLPSLSFKLYSFVYILFLLHLLTLFCVFVASRAVKVYCVSMSLKRF